MSKFEWIAQQISGYKNVLDVRPGPSGTIEVARIGLPATLVAPIDSSGSDWIGTDAVAPFFDGDETPSFAVSVPSKSVWKGEAIDFVRSNGAAYGRMGALQKALSKLDVASEKSPFDFFERGLRQHSEVDSVELIYESVFRVNRDAGRRPLVVAVIDAYEMSAEHVRNCREKFGHFDIGVKQTSYGRVASSAYQAAESMEAEVMMWSELLKRLRRA